MPRILNAGLYTITSLSEGAPLGVNLTRPGSQFVYLDAPVFKWDVQIVNDKIYRLKIGGYSFTGGRDGYVNASTSAVGSQDWLLTWNEAAEAHVIQTSSEKDRKTWTANRLSPADDSQKQVQLTDVFDGSAYLPTQLFRFESVSR